APSASEAAIGFSLSTWQPALSAEGAALVDLAAETGRIHAVIQNRRFISGVRRLRRFVDSGAIGELTGIHCDFFLAP
ncbi:gfo/Idh/MocA family oxidoreductase, partial [Rhizobium leguminosarum]